MTSESRLLCETEDDIHASDSEGGDDKKTTSLCRYLSAAVQEEDDVTSYINHVMSLFNQSLLSIFIRILITSLAVAIFIIGLIRFRKCTLEQEIPLFLVLEGAVIVLKSTVNLIGKCQRSRSKVDVGERNTMDTISDVLTLFLVLWTLTGGAWVLGAYRLVNTEDPSSTDYCDGLVYNMSLAVIMSVIIIGLAACVAVATLAGIYCHNRTGAKSEYGA